MNLGQVLLTFAFVVFTLTAVFWAPWSEPHRSRGVAAGLAFLVAAMLFGGVRL